MRSWSVERMWRLCIFGAARSSMYALLCLLIVAGGLVSSAAAQNGSLETMREDVRGADVGGSGGSSDSILAKVGGSILSTIFSDDSRDDCSYNNSHSSSGDSTFDGNGNLGLVFGAALIGGAAVTSPIWLPINIVEDGRGLQSYFPRFPYDHTPGYIIYDYSPEMDNATQAGRRPRRWAGRMRFDYCDDFDDLQRVGYHLLLATSSRFGIETEMNYLQEQFSDAPHDRIWLGDCNAIYRFAQNERMQWRVGLGFNWLDDDVRTDFGFNFTYGMDYFPRRPWVISSTIDWGNIGSAELFRFRVTGGVIIHGIEGFVGYEYFDLDRSQFGGLIAGLRVWF